jgi:hypothetical protein
MTVVMAAAALDNRPPSFGAAFKKVKGRFFQLLLVSFAIMALLGVVTGREIALLKMGFDFAGKGFLNKGLQVIGRSIHFINFFVSILVQTFVVFVFPLIVLENQKLFPAIGKSLASWGCERGADCIGGLPEQSNRVFCRITCFIANGR